MGSNPASVRRAVRHHIRIVHIGDAPPGIARTVGRDVRGRPENGGVAAIVILVEYRTIANVAFEAVAEDDYTGRNDGRRRNGGEGVSPSDLLGHGGGVV